jgi:membrane-bound lytic murein transglycosylase D
MKKLKNIFAIIALIFLSIGLLIFATTNKTNSKTATTLFPTEIDFAGEKTPLHLADVRERFDRELIVNINLNASTLLILKRANRVFPIIEPILKEYNVPDDFKYLAVIESNLVNVTSPAGAKGIWQIMPETGREKGLEINDNIDERYHLEKATIAACKYLSNAYSKYNSWTMAAASYNGGVAGLNKQIDLQKMTSYYDLLLNEETSRYVFRILALKQIMKNASLYGFNVNPSELYTLIPTKKIAIDSTINDLSAFAIKQGINYKILKIHNSWLRDKLLSNPSRKLYTIEIPTDGYKN